MRIKLLKALNFAGQDKEFNYYTTKIPVGSIIEVADEKTSAYLIEKELGEEYRDKPRQYSISKWDINYDEIKWKKKKGFKKLFRTMYNVITKRRQTCKKCKQL